MREDVLITQDYTKNLRRKFADLIYEKMSTDPNIIVITGDLGYKIWDPIRKDFPDRFINAGAAEQAMVGIAVGLALEGYIPIVYSITTFLLYRPFETIRNYLNHEKIPVKLIGSGRDKDYTHDGISHWSTEDKQVLAIFSEIIGFWPNDVDELSQQFDKILYNNLPTYVNLKK